MPKFELEKYVRTGIPAGHEAEGGSCTVAELDGEEERSASFSKIHEELGELEQDCVSSAKEFGDVIEAVLLAANAQGFSSSEVFEAIRRRIAEMGPLSLGAYVTTVEVPDDSWLAEYYGSRPERFPEIS